MLVQSPMRNFDYQKKSTRFRSGGVRSRENDDQMALVRFSCIGSGCLCTGLLYVRCH